MPDSSGTERIPIPSSAEIIDMAIKAPVLLYKNVVLLPQPKVSIFTVEETLLKDALMRKRVLSSLACCPLPEVEMEMLISSVGSCFVALAHNGHPNTARVMRIKIILFILIWFCYAKLE